MADDIFLTPEEQDERARQWLKDNGPALLIGIVLGLGAIFGWDYYKDSKQKEAENASALYQTALDEIKASELSDIQTQVAELKEKYGDSSYAAKAALLRAKQLSVSDMAAAFDELQWVIDNSQESGLQHTARIRQIKIKLALGELDAAQALAGYSPTLNFESHYAELLGDIAVQKGDEAAARSHYQRALDTLVEGQNSYAQILTIKMDRLPEPASTEADESAQAVDAASSDSDAEAVTE